MKIFKKMMAFKSVLFVVSMLMLPSFGVTQIDLSREMARTIMDQYRDSLGSKKIYQSPDAG
jgi:hypothetical protein